MTEDLIAMAREAGFYMHTTETPGQTTVETDEMDEWSVLARFAALIEARAVARTREECAKVAESEICSCCWPEGFDDAAAEIAAAIRALGERT